MVLDLLLASVAVLLVCSLGAAARALHLRHRNDRTRDAWDALEARLTPRLLEILHDGEEAARIHAELAPRDRLPFVQILLRFARRLSGAERAALEQAALPFLHLLADRVRHRRVEERARAVQTLAELALERYRAAVEGALHDEAPLVRLAAAQGLARNRTEADARVLVRELSAFSGWRRSFLASLLTEVGPAAIPSLLEALEDPDRPREERAVAAAALARLHPQDAVPSALAILAREGRLDDEVMAGNGRGADLLVALLDLLGEVGDPRGLEGVLPRVLDPREGVRGAALEALARLAADAEYAPLLARALADPSAFVALRAARGMLRSGNAALLREAALGEGRGAEVARLALQGGA